MIRKLAVIAVVVLATAQAGTTVTVTSDTWELRDSDSHPISKGYKTYEECEIAGKALPGKYLCIGRVMFNVVGFCDPLPAPVTDGLGDYEAHQCPDGPNGPQLYFTQTQPVRDPYPSCAWVDKPVKITECVDIVNPSWMIDATTHVPEPIDVENGTEILVVEPGPWIEGVDYPLGEACPEAAGGNCYASPNKPKV